MVARRCSKDCTSRAIAPFATHLLLLTFANGFVCPICVNVVLS